MPNYQKLYLGLFNAITDALYLLERGDPDAAKAYLIAAQLSAEELYISDENE